MLIFKRERHKYRRWSKRAEASAARADHICHGLPDDGVGEGRDDGWLGEPSFATAVIERRRAPLGSVKMAGRG